MYHFLVGTAALLFIIMVVPDLVLLAVILVTAALILGIVGAVVAACFIWPKTVGAYVIAMTLFFICWFAWDAFMTWVHTPSKKQ